MRRRKWGDVEAEMGDEGAKPRELSCGESELWAMDDKAESRCRRDWKRRLGKWEEREMKGRRTETGEGAKSLLRGQGRQQVRGWGK